MANPNIVSVTSIKGESVGYNLTATTTTTLLTVSTDKLINNLLNDKKIKIGSQSGRKGSEPKKS